MRIRSLKLQGLTTHTNTSIELPATGLVVIVGDNGSGKSTLVEAPPVCRWGKSLRGTDVWAGDGVVEVGTYDGPTYTRTHKGSRSTLRTDTDVFQTATRATRELGGDLKTWRRTCVFSGEDSTTFLQANDTERKTMLEGIFGYRRFDEALKSCRDEIDDITHQIEVLDAKIEGSRTKLMLIGTAMERTNSRLAACLAESDIERTESDYCAATEAVTEAETHYADMCGRVEELQKTALSASHTCDQALADVRSLGDSVCATCKRPYEEGPSSDDVAATKARHVTADQASRRASTALQQCRSQRVAAERAVASRRNVAESAFRRLTEARSSDETRKAAEAEIRSYGLDREDALDESAYYEAQREALVAKKRTLEYVKTNIVGTRGFRSQILSEALEGLESAANYWMQRFAPGVEIKIEPMRELKNGTVRGEIDVQLHGLANGHGYRGSSRGERRRLDVAITWALGEVEAAVQGLAESTIFCDEPFDALDPAGVSALVDAMSEVRERRCVVVITHSTNLVAALRPDRTYRVDAGEVTEWRRS